MTIADWLKEATNELADDMLPSPRLDAEIILAHTLKHPRTYLHAHTDEVLSMRTIDIANARIELRKDRVPVAYIIGHKEFYGRRFMVSPSVLIPRPESEEVITLLKQSMANANVSTGEARLRLVDIGTGSGCLGVTAKLELPELDVALCDTSRYALAVAQKNATALGAEVETFQSDLLASYPYSPDIVLANLPYVVREWDQSPELAHEPEEALFVEGDGLDIIRKCIDQAAARCKPQSLLILEADTRQLDTIIAYATQHSFKLTARTAFGLAFWLN